LLPGLGFIHGFCGNGTASIGFSTAAFPLNSGTGSAPCWFGMG
jgi:hypothetical protein